LRIKKLSKFVFEHSSAQILNRIKKEINHKRCIVKYSPVHLVLEVTNRCNMNCRFCSTKKYRRESNKKDLSFKDGKRIFDKFNKSTSVNLSGSGETFLNSNLFDLVEYAKLLKMKVNVTTNGTLINKRMEELLDSNIDELEISIKGINPNDYKQFTGRNESEFYQIVDSIKKLPKVLNKTTVKISYVCDREKARNIPHILDIARECDVNGVMLYNLIPMREFNNENYCLNEEDEMWVSTIINESLNTSDKFSLDRPKFYSLSEKDRNCQIPFLSLRIGLDGGVSGCGRAISPSLINGNAFKDIDIFNTKHFRETREQFINNDKKLRYECFYCGLR